MRDLLTQKINKNKIKGTKRSGTKKIQILVFLM